MFDLNTLSRDHAGYLTNLQDWSEAVATAIALETKIELTAAHWQIIHEARAFYHAYQTSPAIRALLKSLKNKDLNFSSIELAKLFPNDTAKLINKIAGLPKPVRCI